MFRKGCTSKKRDESIEDIAAKGILSGRIAASAAESLLTPTWPGTRHGQCPVIVQDFYFTRRYIKQEKVWRMISRLNVLLLLLFCCCCLFLSFFLSFLSVSLGFLRGERLACPGLVHSGSASSDDCEWAFPNQLRLRSFPDKSFYTMPGQQSQPTPTLSG